MDIFNLVCIAHRSTLHTSTHFIWTGSIRITQIQTCVCLYAYWAQNINSYELVLEASHCHTVLISQHCNFIPVNFVYFRISVF